MDGKKKGKDAFRLKFFFEVYDHFVVRMLSWTSRNSHAPPDHGIILGKLQVWVSVMCLCVQWVDPAKVASCYRHSTLVSSGLSRYVCFLQAAKRKRCVHLSQGGKYPWAQVSLWCQMAHLFRHVQIALVRGLLGNCYFCIYFNVIVLS